MKFTKSKKSLLTDTWLLETISVLFSALALAVIFALLNHNNQKPIFKWHDLTLNTLVSIFTTIAKTLLMFTVSSCIGQWKYITFSRNRRKLIEFATLDSASRGPKGSFDLLWQTRFGYEREKKKFGLIHIANANMSV